MDKGPDVRDNTVDETLIHKDNNGTVLTAGDTVILIKDLDMKGGGFTANEGQWSAESRLLKSSTEQIEGQVNGQ